MNDIVTDDKVFQVLDQIGRSPRQSQRQIASTTGFSLGMVNLILRRLIKTGHLKVSSLNRKKFEYLLTAKGMIEKAERTYHYVSRTIQTFNAYQTRMEALLNELESHRKGTFAVMGDNEIAALLQNALRARKADFRVIEEGVAPRRDETLLDCRLNGRHGSVGISVLSKLIGVAAEPTKTATRGRTSRNFTASLSDR